MIAKPAKIPIISFNNNTPGGIQSRETPSESLKSSILLKSNHISPNPGEYHFLGTWRIEVRKRNNPRKILCPTHNPRENSMQTIQILAFP